MNENTFEIIDLIQRFDENWSGLIDLQEYTSFIYSVRQDYKVQHHKCSKLLKDIFNPEEIPVKRK